MKLLFFSDCHFMSVVPSDLPPYRDRLEYQVQACGWVAKMVEEHNPDCVINLGDSNTTHASVTMDALNAFGNGMARVLEACVKISSPFFIVAGNHDLSDRAGYSSFLGGLRPCHPLIRLVVTEPVTFGDGDLALIPYRHDPEDFMRKFAKVQKNRVVAVHQDLKGALWSPGHPAESGVEMGDLTGPSLVVGGHYHHPQRFKSKNVAIVGSPFYATWSDQMMKRPRGALLVEDGTKLTWLMNPHTPLRHTVHAKSVADVAAWVEETKQSRWFKPLDCGRLHLRLVCPSTEVFDECAEYLVSSLPRLLSLTGRVKSVAHEIRVDPTLAMDEPVAAVRALAAGSSEEYATSEELCAFGMEALNGKAAPAVRA